MPNVRIPIQTLSGGVSRRETSKRLPQEVEVADNVILTVERSAEKRAPLLHIRTDQEGDYLAIPNVIGSIPPEGSGATDPLLYYNTDNLMFHFVDVDGENRYCIVLNRAVEETSLMVRVFRIEPTEWIEEEFDHLSFDRGMKEYLLHHNLQSDGNEHLEEIMGSVSYGAGAIFFNKKMPLAFLPDNSNRVVENPAIPGFFEPDPGYIHSGDKIRYKTADMFFVTTTGAAANGPPSGPSSMTRLPGANEEDVAAVPYPGSVDEDGLYSKWISIAASASGGGYKNVYDDIETRVNSETLEVYDVGHSILNFSKIQVPPSPDDRSSHCGWKAQAMFKHLYHRSENGVSGETSPDSGYLTSPFSDIRYGGSIFYYPNSYVFGTFYGKGEMWYTREPFFSFPSGYYRVVSNVTLGQPYYMRARAEDADSVIDHRTFPIIIRKTSAGTWKAQYSPLIPKVSGTKINNPGPNAIKEGETVKSVEFWRDRLWVATDTTIFASRTGDHFNFFIDDIYNVVDTDPIDISVSTGQFNKVQSLTAFQNLLFITTKSGSQFEIRGSSTASGTVTPTSVELRSTSFFTTASTAHPIKMGNNIYFFDKQRLYLYSGSDVFGSEYSTAYDISQHCQGYLPEDYQTVSVIPTFMTIVMVDRKNKNHIYFYTQKTNGDKLVQNAFYRWVLDPKDVVLSVKGYEGGIYIVVKRPDTHGPKIFVYYGTLDLIPEFTPYADRLIKVPSSNIEFDSNTGLTTIELPFFDSKMTEVVLADDWSEDRRYTRHQAKGIAPAIQDGYTKSIVVVEGNVASERVNNKWVARSLWVGRPYEMVIELSTPHLRNQEGISVPGVLNIKRLTTRHRNTGQYDVEVVRYNRAGSYVRSEAFSLNDSTDLLGSGRIEKEGELLSKVLGYADSTKIRIRSLYPTPCNITNIELQGNFRAGNTSIQK